MRELQEELDDKEKGQHSAASKKSLVDGFQSKIPYAGKVGGGRAEREIQKENIVGTGSCRKENSGCMGRKLKGKNVARDYNEKTEVPKENIVSTTSCRKDNSGCIGRKLKGKNVAGYYKQKREFQKENVVSTSSCRIENSGCTGIKLKGKNVARDYKQKTEVQKENIVSTTSCRKDSSGCIGRKLKGMNVARDYKEKRTFPTVNGALHRPVVSICYENRDDSTAKLFAKEVVVEPDDLTEEENIMLREVLHIKASLMDTKKV